MSDHLHVTQGLAIPLKEIELSFVRASGPGGQNVNKVATAVQLRFNARSSPSLPEGISQRLVDLAGARATRDGEIVMTADTHRSQSRNRAEVLERFAGLVRAATHVPRKRRPTRPTLASKRRRLDSKSKRGSIKALRGNRPMIE